MRLLLLCAALAAPARAAGGEAERGRALVTRTRELLPANDPGGLNCTSCHLDEGRSPSAAPWTGLAGAFPSYLERRGRAVSLAERVADCFERSLNGTAPAPDSPEMKAIVAYIGRLSSGTGPGVRGLPRLASGGRPDAARGRRLYRERCARCHGRDGAGRDAPGGAYLYPPLWGPRAFNVGASMARAGTAAAFIRANMPRDGAGTLTDREARDVAEYVTRRPRPDFAGKAGDWPKGGKPADARY